jgi:hypothetical protein
LEASKPLPRNRTVDVSLDIKICVWQGILKCTQLLYVKESNSSGYKCNPA